MQLNNIGLLLTPTDYQGSVEVELHPSHVTTEAGLVLLGSCNLSFVLQDWREHLHEGTLQHYSHLMIHSAGGHLAAVHGRPITNHSSCPILQPVSPPPLLLVSTRLFCMVGVLGLSRPCRWQQQFCAQLLLQIICHHFFIS